MMGRFRYHNVRFIERARSEAGIKATRGIEPPDAETEKVVLSRNAQIQNCANH